MSPLYKLETLIEKYHLEPLNVNYYQMPLYKDNTGRIYAIECFDKKKDLYRVYISWRTPIDNKALESLVYKK